MCRCAEKWVLRGVRVMTAAILLTWLGWAMAADAHVKKIYLKAPATYFDSKQSIALLQAAMAGDLAKAKTLVAAGANLQARGRNRKQVGSQPLENSDCGPFLGRGASKRSAGRQRTYNAAGLHPNTVARYSEDRNHMQAEAAKIAAFRIDGEVLTKTQESLWGSKGYRRFRMPLSELSTT